MLSHKGTQTLHTARLTLRRFVPADAEPMFRNWANDPEVTRFLTWAPHGTVDVSNSVIAQWVAEYAHSNIYNWAIVPDEPGEAIGGISVVSLDDANACCEIGYCIAKAYWSKGITAEALRCVIDFLFSQVGMNRIVARHDPNNPASGRVMQKSGMLYEGTQRQVKFRQNAGYYDLAVYAILKSDWHARLS